MSNGCISFQNQFELFVKVFEKMGMKTAGYFMNNSNVHSDISLLISQQEHLGSKTAM